MILKSQTNHIKDSPNSTLSVNTLMKKLENECQLKQSISPLYKSTYIVHHESFNSHINKSDTSCIFSLQPSTSHIPSNLHQIKTYCILIIRKLYEFYPCCLPISRTNHLDWHIGTILQCDNIEDLSEYITVLYSFKYLKKKKDEESMQDIYDIVICDINFSKESLTLESSQSIYALLDNIRIRRENYNTHKDLLYNPKRICNIDKNKLNTLNEEFNDINKNERVNETIKKNPIKTKSKTDTLFQLLPNPTRIDSSRIETETHAMQKNITYAENLYKNKTVKGVSFDRSKRNWEASWLDIETGRRIKKCFSEGRWGSSARIMAIMARKKAERTGCISYKQQFYCSECVPSINEEQIQNAYKDIYVYSKRKKKEPCINNMPFNNSIYPNPIINHNNNIYIKHSNDLSNPSNNEYNFSANYLTNVIEKFIQPLTVNSTLLDTINSNFSNVNPNQVVSLNQSKINNPTILSNNSLNIIENIFQRNSNITESTPILNDTLASTQ